ncbi:MAG TPA: DUF2339 domain-containing protein [Candidatus Kapabacteria bacterium]|nr:DUF2339 domain-containing protein [Candidatus Kapabacteria bacterium]
MTEKNSELHRLAAKVESLQKQHEAFSDELQQLRDEISHLQSVESTPDIVQNSAEEENINAETVSEQHNENHEKHVDISPPIIFPTIKTPPPMQKAPTVDLGIDIEKLIGENIINKIGIIITVIGIAIGAKYAIDHELISPLTRIILGYAAGLGLLGFAIKLKQKYENYSAVLLSGAMATMYFITFAAYSYYDLIPQILSFALMVMFTIFTVTAAIIYNKHIVAHIGLVGAYAVPFLLSQDSGRADILFTYISIINTGILFTAFKKYWRSLNYSAFGITWIIFLTWYNASYRTYEIFRTNEDFFLGLTFLFIFFSIFYTTFLSYKLIKKEQFEYKDIALILINSFIMYGVGYSILDNHPIGTYYLGLFTVLNAIIHSIVSLVVFRNKLADKALFYLVSGLVLVFLTLTAPVQLDGNWVTLLWAGEATLLFWLGRTKNISFYEKFSYPLMMLSFFSLMNDWHYRYVIIRTWDTRITPLINIHFLTSLLFVIAFGFLTKINAVTMSATPFSAQKLRHKILSIGIPAILLIAIYCSFFFEIDHYFNQVYGDSLTMRTATSGQYSDSIYNHDIMEYKKIALVNYTMFFIAMMTLLNIKRLRNRYVGTLNFVLGVVGKLLFLTAGLYAISELRESYLGQNGELYHHSGNIFYIIVRYISLVFVGLLLAMGYKNSRQEYSDKVLRVVFDFVLHIAVLWIISSELIHWMDILSSMESYKLGLSILWGIYSLSMIVLGIAKKQKHIRIGAMVLFAGTLVKLFIYDIAHLTTIAKTIVFVCLGVLLLIISFLYNKYTLLISDEKTSVEDNG